jgi:hypothetical protein
MGKQNEDTGVLFQGDASTNWNSARGFPGFVVLLHLVDMAVGMLPVGFEPLFDVHRTALRMPNGVGPRQKKLGHEFTVTYVSVIAVWKDMISPHKLEYHF